ncbi:MAG: capsule assembly Wzi family protein [bacterium]
MVILLILLFYYPIDSWQNEVLEEIQVRGMYHTKFPGIRPLGALNLSSTNDEEINITLLSRLWTANVSVNAKFDTIKVVRLKPMVNYGFSNFSLYLQPDVKFGTDSLPPNRVFKNLFSADYERAWAKFQNQNFLLFVGRERFAIGPSPRYNILLSGYGAPLDWFNYAITAKFIKLSYFLSRLDDLRCKPVEYVGDTITTLINARRYLLIKRLDFSPVDWFNCSFSEAATFGGENYELYPYQLNPLVFLHTFQHNWDKAANLFFHLDAKIFLHKKAIYGALLVDDYQLEPDPNGEPNHYGFKIGFESADLFKNKSFFILEYSLLSRWIYAIFTPYQRYEYLNHPIGFPYGPDCDEVYAKWVQHLDKSFDVYFESSLLRKGETEVNTPWPVPEEPRVPGTHFPEENYLSGIVQQSFHFAGGLRFFKKNYLVIELLAGYSLINNFHHNRDLRKTNPELRFKIDFINLSSPRYDK